MPDRYWVGSTTSWNTAGNWSSTNGGAGGAGVPNINDVVYFTNSNNTNCVLDAGTYACRGLFFTDYTGLFNYAGYGFNVGTSGLALGTGTTYGTTENLNSILRISGFTNTPMENINIVSNGKRLPVVQAFLTTSSTSGVVNFVDNASCFRLNLSQNGGSTAGIGHAVSGAKLQIRNGELFNITTNNINARVFNILDFSGASGIIIGNQGANNTSNMRLYNFFNYSGMEGKNIYMSGASNSATIQVFCDSVGPYKTKANDFILRNAQIAFSENSTISSGINFAASTGNMYCSGATSYIRWQFLSSQNQTLNQNIYILSGNSCSFDLNRGTNNPVCNFSGDLYLGGSLTLIRGSAGGSAAIMNMTYPSNNIYLMRDSNPTLISNMGFSSSNRTILRVNGKLLDDPNGSQKSNLLINQVDFDSNTSLLLNFNSINIEKDIICSGASYLSTTTLDNVNYFTFSTGVAYALETGNKLVVTGNGKFSVFYTTPTNYFPTGLCKRIDQSISANPYFIFDSSGTASLIYNDLYSNPQVSLGVHKSNSVLVVTGNNVYVKNLICSNGGFISGICDNLYISSGLWTINTMGGARFFGNNINTSGDFMFNGLNGAQNTFFYNTGIMSFKNVTTDGASAGSLVSFNKPIDIREGLRIHRPLTSGTVFRFSSNAQRATVSYSFNNANAYTGMNTQYLGNGTLFLDNEQAGTAASRKQYEELSNLGNGIISGDNSQQHPIRIMKTNNARSKYVNINCINPVVVNNCWNLGGINSGLFFRRI